MQLDIEIENTIKKQNQALDEKNKLKELQELTKKALDSKNSEI